MMNKKYTHVFRPATLALLVALAAACGKDSPIAPDPDHGQGTPIAIGQLPVAAAAADPNAAGTYWRDGDAILVSATNAAPDVPDAPVAANAAAPNPNAAPLTAIYTYNGGSWTPKADTDPLYVEHIFTDLTHPIIIKSWGGKSSSGIDDDSKAYTDQSDPAERPINYIPGDRYRRNDYLQCLDAKLTVRTLSGKLTHSRVDFVLNIADYTDANDSVLNTLPINAVLKLNDGSTPPQTVITAYRQGKTADGTTFRAYIDLEDVPGITGITPGSGTPPSGTVRDGSLLGTLTYTMPGSTPKTLKIRYSITSGGTPGASGTAVPITPGKCITVSATFADPSYLDATASLKDWEDIDAGEAGTGDINMVKVKDEKGDNKQPIYEIYSAQGLKKFADLVNGTGDYTSGGKNTSANARLMADIDLSTVCSAALVKSWEPIGTNSSNAYIGCFDGQEYTVKGLYIDGKGTDYTGLFGYIGQDGAIRHLRVEAVKISSSAQYTGVLAGLNGGTITACQAAGDVTGKNNTGGLVGDNSGTITACCATGKVTGTGDYTGGLAGRNNSGTITACYTTSNVTGASATGGLVGYNTSTITACYATSNVTGTSTIGGLVGLNSGTGTACYATGKVTGASITGGLVGQNNPGCTLQYCATTQSNIFGTNNGTFPGSESNVTSFSDIRDKFVAASDAQTLWGKSIGPDGLVQDPADPDGRILDAPWDAPTNARAIWKTPADGTGPGDKITGGHLQLWWQTNP